MINTLFFVLCLVTSSVSHRVDGIQNAVKEVLEFERELKLINKPPVKSIHTKLGDIVDCIDMYKQPAFDHPLLKNHKLQRKPSFQTFNEKTSLTNSSTKPIFGLDEDFCPIGTVPIPRTTKDDLIRAKSLLSNQIIMTHDIPGLHVAEISLIPVVGPYYGVSGTTSVWKPKVGKNQVSLAHLWVQNGDGDGTNRIAAGWHVDPNLYGDDNVHVYAVWTSDNLKKTGCYNYRCRGFVQIDKQNYLGSHGTKTSVYNEVMMELRLSILQDPVTKNWWVRMTGKNIGYFPAALFSNMHSANQAGWGGRTVTPPHSPSPPMGSGHFPNNNMRQACYFRSVLFHKSLKQLGYEPEAHSVQKFTDKPNCFGVEFYGHEGEAGSVLQFGGPGGNCDN